MVLRREEEGGGPPSPKKGDTVRMFIDFTPEEGRLLMEKLNEIPKEGDWRVEMMEAGINAIRTQRIVEQLEGEIA